MANLTEIPKYKNTILSLIISNENIVDLLSGNIEQSEDLIGVNLFDYPKIPLAEEELAYITVEIDVPTMFNIKNKIFRKPQIVLDIIVHDKLMKTNTIGNRLDLLCSEIDRAFNGFSGLGFKNWEFDSLKSIYYTNRHYGKRITFSAVEKSIESCVYT